MAYIEIGKTIRKAITATYSIFNPINGIKIAITDNTAETIDYSHYRLESKSTHMEHINWYFPWHSLFDIHVLSQ